MPIITVDRPRLLGGQYLQQDLKTKFPATTGFTAYPGDLLTMSSGYALVNNTASGTATSSAGAAGILGIAECPAAFTIGTAGDPILATLLMPHILYEANIIASVTVAQTAFIGGLIAPVSIVAYTGTNIGVTGQIRGFGLSSVTNVAGSGGPFQVIAFKGYEDQYITHTVFNAAGTVASAGATHIPSVDAGTTGDQLPRAIFTPNPAYTIWGMNWGTASNDVINHY